MIIEDFLSWVKTAPDGPRADAAGALTRAWLYSSMSEDERRGAAAALTLLLDDPCLDVRLAVAESLAASANAPGHIVRCLAHDVEDVAEPVLQNSPVLTDEELVDLAAQCTSRLQVAIAQRRPLSPMVGAAIAEVGEPAACAALLDNARAGLLVSSIVRLCDRFGDLTSIRERLLRRADLPIIQKHQLLRALALQLENHPAVPDQARADFVSEAGDKVILRLALDAADDELPLFVEDLRAQGLINTRLLLRAVCCGRLRLFVHALSVLGHVPVDRLCATLRTVRPVVVRALLRKAGLPLRSHTAFLLAIDVTRRAETDFTCDLGIDQARLLTEYLLHELQDETIGGDADIVAFLRRFSVDVARLEARAYVEQRKPEALKAA
ncbi:MAG: DUF2336 domain-containing protein [Roseibium sp.]|nr:DUF2336 domain-containing protein [Roseibium sp.]